MNRQPASYLQTDSRWKKISYAVKGETATIGGSGCGPASAAMLIETLTGQTFTPVDACAWALKHGYKALNQGTYHSYFVPQFAAHGIACKRLNASSIGGNANSTIHDEALALLRNGWYLIALMGKGLWTSSGHYIVVWWADSKYHINDPASTRPARLVGDSHTFRSQAKYYWAIDARAYNQEDDDMAKYIEQIATAAGVSTDTAVANLAVLVKLANTKEDAWEKEGLTALSDMGLINAPRAANAPVAFGEVGLILKRFKEKYCK